MKVRDAIRMLEDDGWTLVVTRGTPIASSSTPAASAPPAPPPYRPTTTRMSRGCTRRSDSASRTRCPEQVKCAYDADDIFGFN